MLRSKTEDALDTALLSIARNLVAYAEGNFTATSEKDKRIQRVTDALARSQQELAGQIANYLEELHREPQLGYFPSEYAGLNFVSYTSSLGRVLADLSNRHAKVQKTKNDLLEAIQRAQNAAAFLTATQTALAKSIEKLNAECAGICPPAKVAADPAELKTITPVVKVIEVVEHVGVGGGVAVAVAAPAADAHAPAHGGHDDHGHGAAHDDHGHGEAHAPAAAAAVAEAAPAAAPEAAPAAAAPAAAAPEPEAKKSDEEEDKNFVATWKPEPIGKLDPAKSNFLLASETTSADLLTKLAKDPLHLVRCNVVANANTPKNIVEALKGDPSIYVRRAAKEKLGA
jgi:hypothetical protein